VTKSSGKTKKFCCTPA